MRTLVLLLSAMMLAVAGMAKDPSTMQVFGIRPYQATPADVEALLGTPVKKERNDKLEQWFYRNNERGIIITWDLQTVRVKSYTVSRGSLSKEWKSRYAAKLHTGKTEVGDVVRALGMPTNANIELNTQHLNYSYPKHVVQMSFRNGVLLNYEVHGLMPKSVAMN